METQESQSPGTTKSSIKIFDDVRQRLQELQQKPNVMVWIMLYGMFAASIALSFIIGTGEFLSIAVPLFGLATLLCRYWGKQWSEVVSLAGIITLSFAPQVAAIFTARNDLVLMVALMGSGVFIQYNLLRQAGKL